MRKVIGILGILSVFTLFAPHDAAAALIFPADAGALNVRDFGAKGDGVTDDTAAINAALTKSGGDTGQTFWQDRIVYFPSGTYIVSGPILKRYTNGNFGNGSILVGHAREDTIIKLADKAAGYGDAREPKAIIFTTSKLIDGNATTGGKDYINKGEGNDAYMNFVENLTVDAGKGNPGAIGIDYLSNNMGAIRNVLVRAPEGSGAVGIALTRKWAGPSLIENVEVNGFATGISADNTEYGMTLEKITLRNQHTALQNNHNMLSIHGLTIENAEMPISNLSADGMITLVGARILHTGKAQEAIGNNGVMNINRLNVSGYQTILGIAAAKWESGVYTGNALTAPANYSLSLPIEQPPVALNEPTTKWVSVASYVKPDTGADTTEGIRKAFASGASTIYFPHGVYLIHDNIVVPPTVQRIVGMTSTIRPGKDRLPSFSRDKGMFRTTNNKNPLVIEKLAFDNSWMGDQVGVEVGGAAALHLQDVVGAGVETIRRLDKGGKVYIENTCCGTMNITGRNGVWIRQLNSEGPDTRIVNTGAPLWILGIKTEQNCTILDNSNGARTNIMGGLVYITGKDANPGIPAFRNTDAQVMLSYVEEAFNAGGTYAVHLVSTRDGKSTTTSAEQLPKRNIARMVPQLVGY